MHNIWNVLQIPQTTDKKVIKRAYAQLAKTVHPEEKPEEFKQLYRAYQAAIAYADKKNSEYKFKETLYKWIEVEDGQRKKADTDKNSSQEKEQQWTEVLSEGEAELEKAFQDIEKRKAEQKLWENFIKERCIAQDEHEVWLKFMNSDFFKEHQMDSEMAANIINSLENSWRIPSEVYLVIWEQYGFKDSEQELYQNEVSQLYHILYRKLQEIKKEDARIQREKEAAEAKKKRRDELKELCIYNQRKAVRVRIHWKRRFAAFLLIVILIFSVKSLAERNWNDLDVENAFEDYIQQKYPDSSIILSGEWKVGWGGKRVYKLYSADYPDIAFKAEVKPKAGGYQIEENYGSQFFVQRGKEYGLHCEYIRGKNDNLVFYSPSIVDKELDFFLDQVEKFIYSGQFGEIYNDQSVVFWVENLQIPDTYLYGGEFGFPKRMCYSIYSLPKRAWLKWEIKNNFYIN